MIRIIHSMDAYLNYHQNNSIYFLSSANWLPYQLSSTVMSKNVIFKLCDIASCIESVNKGNNKITELRTILQRESQNS